MSEALLEFFGGDRYLALGTLGSLALALVAVMAAVALAVCRRGVTVKEMEDMDKKVMAEIDVEAYGRAGENLNAALTLLDQVRSMVPPFFVERFRACVSGAMHELGIVKKH